jgi:hypothetical protein
MQTQEICLELRQRKTRSNHLVGTSVPCTLGKRERRALGTQEIWVEAQASSLTFTRVI